MKAEKDGRSWTDDRLKDSLRSSFSSSHKAIERSESFHVEYRAALSLCLVRGSKYRWEWSN